MRNKTREFSETQIVKTTVVSDREEIVFISEDKTARMVQVKVQCFDGDLPVGSFLEFTIVGDDYTLLMSASPEFAPGKPGNEYREIDLWYVIDMASN